MEVGPSAAPMMAMEAASCKLKAEQARHRQREEDAELRRRAEEQQLRVGQQRAEVDHRADADEQQQREKLVRDARVETGFAASSSAPELGRLHRIAPKPMGSSSVGSISLLMAR